MISWQTDTVLGSIALIELMFRKLREVIDTDESIPPELRLSLHATLDERLISGKKRLLDSIGRQNGAWAMPMSPPRNNLQ
ncbi:hypothetical protein CQ14_40145 [Bradyrhizobium lablabi]|uniref:Uncharacterized protein n=1 Tax=Bradyrhizobium lablabi TaxID=722472 RepID=A0A0R3MZJ2_9BRAD|nr:hypothetical protein [Bradyrhizobium lablabi]KRR25492.1 hypothetical protein CQ14_40145 [Bradyrhizobium lablabi]